MATTATLNNGVILPILGLGTYRLRDPELTKLIVSSALRLGYKLIDTASGYKNEEVIGKCLKEELSKGNRRREDVFITSKLGPAQHGRQQARATLTKSLSDLQTTYLDLYLIHWPGCSGLQPNDPRNSILRKESWLEMEEMYKEGKIKAIGVSNYTIAHLEELLSYCSIPPAVLQVEIHPFLCQKELRKFCNQHDIHVQAYSSLGASAGCVELMSNEEVQDIAKYLSKSPSQVLLRWAIQHSISIIPKTSRVDRLEENANIFDFSLSDNDMKRLDDLDRDCHYCWDPKLIL
ncbi:uncharacterized protein LOC111630736 isoform X2 [Centruroides sculpturatus]|uniref:uncharacterized protein LOC111630736 isoform X2 n=1 Tax=Centruroides sculpturatus TaxID=218467 RepID=UPI000C6DCF66|nr:uncharacterized protein LOC111630736 isoform X2 [Centruroides sculpturatus]